MLPYGVADGDVPFGAVLFDQDSGAGDEGKRKGEEVKDDGVDDDDDDDEDDDEDNADDSESDSPRALEALLLSFDAFTGVL